MPFIKQNMKANGMKGVNFTGINSLLGKEQHLQQVSPDHHTVTVSINGTKGAKLLGIDPYLIREDMSNWCHLTSSSNSSHQTKYNSQDVELLEH